MAEGADVAAVMAQAAERAEASRRQQRKQLLDGIAEGKWPFHSTNEIYDDDNAIGKPAPAIDVAAEHIVKGEAADFTYGDKPTVVLFWAKYQQSTYGVNEQFAKMAQRFGDKVRFIGAALDAKLGDAEKYISRIGKVMPELGCVITMDFPAMWDEDKKFGKAFEELTKENLGTGQAYLIDADGIIRWRENFSSNYALAQGLFEIQTEKLAEGEELLSVGNTPEQGEEAEEAEDSDVDDELF